MKKQGKKQPKENHNPLKALHPETYSVDGIRYIREDATDLRMTSIMERCTIALEA